MQRYTLTVVDATTGLQLADYTHRARNPSMSADSLQFTVPMRAAEASQFIDDPRLRFLVAGRYGTTRRYALLRPTLVADGVQLVGMNLIAMFDADEYSALWSDSNVAHWEAVSNDQIATRSPEMYVSDKQNRLYATLTKGTTYANATNIFSWDYYGGVANTRQLQIISLNYTINLPVGWRFNITRNDAAYTSLSTILIVNGTGAVQSGSICLPFTACDRIELNIFNISGAAYTNVAETGIYYAKITNLRIATTVTNDVNTTIAGAITAGSATVTPASMANIYVGQRLVINSTLADSETVIVTAMTATTFTAVFASNHAINSTVGAIVVYDSEIIQDMLTQVRTLNPSCGIAPATSLIQSSGLDRLDQAWMYAAPLDVIAELAKPVNYQFGVRGDGALYYQPRGTNARDWAIRAADVEVAADNQSLINSTRVAYQNAQGVVQQTAYSTDSASVAQNGFTRRRTLQAQTTSATEATTIRDTSLADTKNRSVQSRVVFDQLFTRTGILVPNDQVQPGDTITITNLPAVFTGTRIRTFTVAEVTLDMLTDTPSIIPENPLPQLDVLLAQLAAD